MTAAQALTTEVRRFRKWAERYPLEDRTGAWECDYRHWSRLCTAVFNFMEQVRPERWTLHQLDCVLYAIARDNDIGQLARAVRAEHPELLTLLAGRAVQQEPDAMWQLAAELGNAGTLSREVEDLLLAMAHNSQEYVRRQALMALARLGSLHTERLALETWDRPDANQEWARMAVLWSLHRIGSTVLAPLLAQADGDPRPYLAEYAKRVRRDDVEP
jgi:hypothetical protein